MQTTLVCRPEYTRCQAFRTRTRYSLQRPFLSRSSPGTSFAVGPPVDGNHDAICPFEYLDGLLLVNELCNRFAISYADTASSKTIHSRLCAAITAGVLTNSSLLVSQTPKKHTPINEAVLPAKQACRDLSVSKTTAALTRFSRAATEDLFARADGAKEKILEQFAERPRLSQFLLARNFG